MADLPEFPINPTPVAETPTTITLGWGTPPPATDGYVFRSTTKQSRTFDPNRRTVRFEKGTGPYTIEPVTVVPIARGVWPKVGPPITRITTEPMLKSVLRNAAIGERFAVVGRFNGQYDVFCKGGAFDFADAELPGGPGYCSLHCVGTAAELENIEVVGGGSSGGVLVNGGCNGLRITGEIRDCHGTGILVQGIAGSGSNEWVEIDLTIRNCGLDWKNDPHPVGQPGTGWHACYWGGAQLPSRGVAVLRVFDQTAGAAIQIGSNAQDLTVDIEGTRISRNVQAPPFGPGGMKQVAGNVVQFWGTNNHRVTVKRAIGDYLAGRVVETDALDPPSSKLVVEYARGYNLGYNRPPGEPLAPYAPDKGIVTYVDCK